MKTMIKALSLFIAFAFCLSLFASCSKGEQEVAGTISDFESQAHIGVSDTGDTSKAPLTGDFVVSDKKYDYKNGNLELLYVENQTNRHYNVTIHGTYLDEDGETLMEETQTFTGFPAGWSNHFVFYPQMAFDSFTYTVETAEYVPDGITCDESGTPYASFITMSYEKKMKFVRQASGQNDEYGSMVYGKDMYFDTTLETTHPTDECTVYWYTIVLDEQGEIYLTNFDLAEQRGYMYHGVHAEEVMDGTTVGWRDGEDNRIMKYPLSLKFMDADADQTVPENVQGKFTAVFAFTIVEYREPPQIPDDISITIIGPN